MKKELQTVYVNHITENQKRQLFELWNNEYPSNLQYHSIDELDNYLSKVTNKKHILFIDKNKNIQAWFMSFLRDKEQWFLMILASNFQRKGYGTQLLLEGKKVNQSLSGWVIESNNYIKINGEPYKSPVLFYKKNGFNIFPEIQLKSEKLTAIKIMWNR